MDTKKKAEYLPEDLDDVRANPIAYGLPNEATTWDDTKILDAMAEFSEEEMTWASKKTALNINVIVDGAVESGLDSFWKGVLVSFHKVKGFDGEDVDPTLNERLAKVAKEVVTEWVKTNTYLLDTPTNASKKVAKSPPGWSKTVEEMKEHPEIESPFGLARWMSEEGYKPHASKTTGEKMEKKSDYQGWKNYETWNVALWLDNEQGSQEMVREWVTELKAGAAEASQVKEGIWTPDEAVKIQLADRIKALVEDNNPLADQATMYSDLLNGAISEVNWKEVAEHYLEE